MLKIHDFFRLCLPAHPPILPSVNTSLASLGGPRRGAHGLGTDSRASRATCAWTWHASRAARFAHFVRSHYARFARHMRLNLARFARLASFARSRFARHMRFNFARFARLDLKNWRYGWKKVRASRATCAWTSRASRAYTSKIEEMAQKKVLTPQKFKKWLKKKLLQFFSKKTKKNQEIVNKFLPKHNYYRPLKNWPNYPYYRPQKIEEIAEKKVVPNFLKN